MKIITRHYDLFFFLYVPIFLLELLLIFFAAPVIPRLFYIHSLFLLLALVLVFLPRGGISLGTRSTPKSIGFLQIGLCGRERFEQAHKAHRLDTLNAVCSVSRHQISL